MLAPKRLSPPTRGALALLRRRDFRITYSAIAASELGDAFQYIALMWFALQAGGPLGVIAARLADSLPALLFGAKARADGAGSLAVAMADAVFAGLGQGRPTCSSTRRPRSRCLTRCSAG